MPTVLIKGKVREWNWNGAEYDFKQEVAADVKELDVGDVICVCFQ